MPRKPRRGCAYGWCSRLAVDGEKYCEEHLKKETKKYERYGRDQNTKKMYKGNWPKIRERFVKENPYCSECLKAGRLTPTEHVHHIKPISKGGTHEKSNLMALCKSCHSRIHAQQGDRWGRPIRIPCGIQRMCLQFQLIHPLKIAGLFYITILDYLL